MQILMFRDTLRFKSEEEFINWARKNAAKYGKVAMEEVEEIMAHERAHYEMAKKLGYLPVYRVSGILRGYENEPERAIVDAFEIDYEGRRPNPEDLIKIVLAPKNPSEADLDIAERCRKELEKINSL
jgi:hypothetical protein